MKYCTKCGNPLNDEAVTCPKCGQSSGKQASGVDTKGLVKGILMILAGVAIVILTVLAVLAQL